MLIHR